MYHGSVDLYKFTDIDSVYLLKYAELASAEYSVSRRPDSSRLTCYVYFSTLNRNNSTFSFSPIPAFIRA
jgi:hypothetical protein